MSQWLVGSADDEFGIKNDLILPVRIAVVLDHLHKQCAGALGERFGREPDCCQRGIGVFCPRSDFILRYPLSGSESA